MTESISRTFARWAHALDYEALPPLVVEKVKALVLFHLVAASFGAEEERAQTLVDLVKVEEPRVDGATILVDGGHVSRGAAAFANCELADVAGLWDSYRMITHPGPVLVAVGLANAELEQRSGRELITALVAGYEFGCRLADDFVPSVAARGFRPAPIFSTMGAAMVAGKLLGQDDEHLVATIAIAASSCSGLNEPGRVGADERDLQEPNAARQGVFAAQMGNVAHGRASEQSIEGAAGFYAAYAGSSDGQLSYSFTGARRVELASVTEGLGEHFKLLDVMFRIYNASGYNQPVIELMTEMRRLMASPFEVDEVDEVVIEMNYLETLYPSPEFPRYEDPHVGRVSSIQYYCAHVMVNGGYPAVGEEPFGPTGDDLAADEAVLAFMHDKVRLVGVYDQPMFSPQITVRLRDGSIMTEHYPYQRMAWRFDELVENLRRCTSRLPGGAERLAELATFARRLDELDDLRPLFALMTRH